MGLRLWPRSKEVSKCFKRAGSRPLRQDACREPQDRDQLNHFHIRDSQKSGCVFFVSFG